MNGLYKLGESKTVSRDNVEINNDVLQKVNLFYTTFTSLCSHLVANDIIPSTTCTKPPLKGITMSLTKNPAMT